MKTVCGNGKCAGCMVCVEVCAKGAIQVVDEWKDYTAIVDEEKCVACEVCFKVCPSKHTRELIYPTQWYQGWASEAQVRQQGASGGVATAISQAFIKKGGVVSGCVFDGGKFVFELARTVEEVKRFAGSKYVKSNPQGIYKRIEEELKQGKEVLFIGLPCQVAAVKNYVSTKFAERLYTVDLICHGTPSPKMLENFLQQYGYSMMTSCDIRFRRKGLFQLCNEGREIIKPGVTDRYLIAFLEAITYTDNCYTCSYAKNERVADITLGDSWGTELSWQEQKSGISLLLCQTSKGTQLLEQTELELKSVDLERAIAHNQQLREPAAKPKKRDVFFANVKRGKKFNREILKVSPKQCIKQEVKRVLIMVTGKFRKSI